MHLSYSNIIDLKKSITNIQNATVIPAVSLKKTFKMHVQILTVCAR
jgi:hypothetical protein